MVPPPPPPHGMIANSVQFSIELIATIIIAILAIIIFNKTRELSKLSGKGSIKLFRYSFLFFSLAYLSRFIIMSSKVITRLSDISRLSMTIIAVIASSLMLFSSFSAILSLGASVLRKIQDKKNVMLIIVSISLLFTLISLFFQMIVLLLFVELVLFILTIILISKQDRTKKRKNRKHKSKLRGIYLLLFISWILSNIMFLRFGAFRIPHELVLIPHILSIVIFSIILERILKWVK